MLHLRPTIFLSRPTLILSLWLAAAVNAIAAEVPQVGKSTYAPETIQQMPQNWRVEIGPFVGGGNLSAPGIVRHASGIGLGADRVWHARLGGMPLQLGPRIDLVDTLVSTKSIQDGLKNIASYDHRIALIGLKLGFEEYSNGVLRGLPGYLIVTTGQSWSKLSVDQTSSRLFKQTQYTDIKGQVLGLELGSSINLKQGFALSLGLIGHEIRLDQSKAKGTYEGELVGNDDTLSLTQGNATSSDGQLADTLTMRTLGFKVGINLVF